MNADELSTWLSERLTGEKGRADWERLVAASVDRALDAPLSDFITRDQVFSLIEAHRTTAVAQTTARFLAGTTARLVVAEAETDEAPVGRWFSDEARDRLMQLLERPGLVDEAWVRQVFAQKAAEELLSDTLYRALLDFSTLVPRIVQSVLPSGLGRLAKLGSKATGGVGNRLLEEIERRLEPEIRKFLDKGTRRALEGAARFAAERIDTPGSIEGRKNIAAFILDQSPAFHVAPIRDPEVLTEIQAITEAWAQHWVDHPEWPKALGQALDRIYADAKDKPLKDWLGLTEPPPSAAWAEALWPLAVRTLQGETAQDWLTGLSQEILDAVGS